MRPIERRLAAVEAQFGPKERVGYRLFILLRDEDEAAFRARCEAEAAGQPCRFIRFVRPGEALAVVLH